MYQRTIYWVIDLWAGKFFKERKKSFLFLIFLLLGIVVVQTFVFSRVHQVNLLLVLFALPSGLLFGVAIIGLEYLLASVRVWIFCRVDRILASFLLFFSHVIGYIVLSSLLISYPLGRVMVGMWGVAGPAGEYGLFTANIILILAIISWVRNLLNVSTAGKMT